MNDKKNTKVIIAGLMAFLALLALLSAGFGRYPISPREIGSIILSKIMYIEPYWPDQTEIILFNVRLPRIALAICVGASLCAAGAAFQGVFQNPMASPDVLGASSGAAFGASFALLNNMSYTLVTLWAFGFGLISITLALFAAAGIRGDKKLGLILSGMIISALLGAGTSLIKLAADPNDQLPAITYWLMGSLAKSGSKELAFVVIPVSMGLSALYTLRWRLNLLALSDDEARSMGVNVKALRCAVILAAALVTAASVSVSGVISWVGLIVPHISRRLVGSNFGGLMPTSMLVGAIFLLLVDNIARNTMTAEIPIGILTAIIGAPFFLYLISKRGDSI